jgi:integrase
MARPRNTVPNFRLTQRGGRFYVAWWADGRGQRISTGSADIGAARRFLADFAAGFSTPEPPPASTIGQVLTGYLADRKAAVASYATLEAATKALRRHLGELSADALTKERASFYARQRRAEGYQVGPPDARRTKPVSNGTITRELVTLRAAYAWARGEGWTVGNPVIPVPPAAPPRDRWLTPAEAGRLLSGCRAVHVRLFVLLALHTAARAGALLALQWRQVDLARRRIDLGPSVGKKGRAVVAINDALLPALMEAHAGRTGDAVIETAAGKPVASIKTGFRAAARRAGLAGVTPHTLRHTAATWMAQAGVPLRDVAGVLGHRDTLTTERVYAHHHPDHMRAATGALSAALPGQLAPETKRPASRAMPSKVLKKRGAVGED